MGDRAKRPLNNGAVKAADDELYAKHADDPRPNPLYDADGNRTPLDANDPDQAGLRKEWMDAYKANGGETEPIKDGGGTADQTVLPCGQKARVDPLIIGDPIELDESEVETEDSAEEEGADEDSEETDDVADDDSAEDESEEGGEAGEEGDGGGEVADLDDGAAGDDSGSTPLKSLQATETPGSPEPDEDEEDDEESPGEDTEQP